MYSCNINFPQLSYIDFAPIHLLYLLMIQLLLLLYCSTVFFFCSSSVWVGGSCLHFLVLNGGRFLFLHWFGCRFFFQISCWVSQGTEFITLATPPLTQITLLGVFQPWHKNAYTLTKVAAGAWCVSPLFPTSFKPTIQSQHGKCLWDSPHVFLTNMEMIYQLFLDLSASTVELAWLRTRAEFKSEVFGGVFLTGHAFPHNQTQWLSPPCEKLFLSTKALMTNSGRR